MMKVIEQIGKSFNRQARYYEQAAKVQAEIGWRLLERLDYLKINPVRILDLGCGPGQFTKALKKKYPKAQVVGLDLAFGMLDAAKQKQSWLKKWDLVNADQCHMPFANGSFDLVFANQVIHWGSSLKQVFRELNRVLNLNGCLMFSTLGPDTFKEINAAWRVADTHVHVNPFPDMHDVGDCLLQERLLDPVVDMEMLILHYSSLKDLISSLKSQGVINIHPSKNKGLTGKTAWSQFKTQYDTFRTEHGKYPLTYEVVYGHAWKGMQRVMDKGTETVIPISSIKRS